MSKDKKKQENIMEEKDNEQEDYTFVRETIKEKPPAFVRFLFKAAKVLGLGVAFGIGVCLVIVFFSRGIGDIFTNDKSGNTEGIENTTDYTGEKNTVSGEEDLSFDEKIKLQIADVVVVYYRQEEETTETESNQETSNLNQGEELTANISDNKEIQTTTSQTEKDSEKKTEKENEEETIRNNENKHIEEKKNYTGLLVDTVGDVLICIENDKISDGEDIFVSFGDGNYAQAEVYGCDAVNGLAVLRVYAKDINEEIRRNLKSANLRNIYEMSDGDKLVYVGNPYGTGRLMYTGTLAGIDDGHCNYDTFYRGIITDIRNEDIKDGFIFDENGNIVAMVDSIDEKLTLGKNISGVCMADIMLIVRALIEGNPIKHIGVKGETVTDDMRELTGESIPDGMYVTDVARDSSAYRSGIMVGDIVISVNESQVTGLKDIQNVLDNVSVNADITLVVKRKIGTSYNEITIKVPVETWGDIVLY